MNMREVKVSCNHRICSLGCEPNQPIAGDRSHRTRIYIFCFLFTRVHLLAFISISNSNFPQSGIVYKQEFILISNSVLQYRCSQGIY